MPSNIHHDELKNPMTHNLRGDYYDDTVYNIGRIERMASLVGGAALMATGVGLAIQRNSAFGLALTAIGGALAYRGATGHCGVYERLGVEEEDADARSNPFTREIFLKKSVKIRKPPEEVYEYWRKLDNLPRVMRHLKSVTRLNGVASDWVAEGPLGRDVKWRARITDDRPGELLSWMSVGDSEIDTTGTVKFQPAGEDGNATRLTVEMRYRPPAGIAGMLLSRMFGADPSQELDEDLQRFRLYMDRGELPPPFDASSS